MILARIRRRLGRSGRDRQRGVTLIEMIVVVSLLAVVLATAQGALLMTQRVVGDNAVRLDEAQQAKTAVDGMTRTMRSAILPKLLNGTCGTCDVAAFIAGTARSVQFYANVDNNLALPASGTTTFGPRRVTYTLATDGTLTETVQSPNVHNVTDFNFTYCTPGPSCPVRTRILARDVVTTTSLFKYYDKAGNTVGVPLEASVSRLQSVDSVDVLLTVKPRERVEGSTVTTRVMLPNQDAAPTPSAS